MPKLFLKPVLTSRDAKAQNTILDNARALFKAGVVMAAVENGWDGLVRVSGATGQYTVDIGAGRCACQSWKWHADCKHRIAAALERGLLTLDDLVVVRADVRRAV